MKPYCLRRFLLVVGLLIGSGATALSAQGVTTAAVSGQVTANGQPLSSAQVLITNTATGATRGVLTRNDGRYLLPGLQPGGPYRVEVQALGYANEVVEDVVLALSQTERVDFELATQAVEIAGVSVMADRGTVISRDHFGTSTVVEDSAISRLPTITRDFTDFARLSPQISTGGAGASAAGRNNRYNTIQIDGAVNNDLFGLAASGTPGGQAGTKPISLEAIQQFEVVISPMDVRQGGFTGAGINAVTKSGTNDFAGSLFFFNKNEALVGNYQNLSGTESRDYPDFAQNEFGFSLGGPIVEDKLHFFINGELVRREAPIGIVAGEGDAEISSAEAQQVSDILSSQYGYNPGTIGAVDLRRESNLAFGRLDWNVNNDHRLTLRHNYVDAFDDNLSRSNSTYRLGGTLYAFNSVTNSTVAQLNSTLSSQLFNELRFGYTTVRDERQVSDPRPSVRTYFVGGSAGRSLYAGSEQFSGQNALDQNGFQITDDLTFVVGDHNLTVGTSNEFFNFSNLFVRNAFGYYEFASPDSLAAGIANRYEYSYLQPGGAERSEFPVRQYAVYAQDQVGLSDNLTVTAGLRLDITSLPEDPAFNQDVLTAFGRNTSDVPTSTLFNPRAGFNWDVMGDQTTQIRGGVGLFSGRTPGVWVSNAYGNTGNEYVRFTCTGTRVPTFVSDPNQQPLGCAGSTSLAPNEINTIDPDFKMPQVWRANVAFDRELPMNFVLSLEGLYTQTINDIIYRDLTVGPSTGVSSEGRVLYSRVTAPGIGNVYEIANTSEGEAYSLTAALQRRFLNNFSLDAAYTYSHATDVNPGTSSQASSNFRFTPIVSDPNNPTVATSDFEVPHRFLASGSYQLEFIDRLATNLSFIYVGESGRPFSFTYNGDVNGDGQFANDLFYVPASAAEVRFAGDAASQSASYAALEQFINRFECLQDARGQILERNSCREPWQNRLDFRVAQVLPTFMNQSAQLTLDVLNVLNLLNSDWGSNQYVPNGEYTVLSTQSSTPDANGRVLFRSFNDGDQNIYDLGDLTSRYQIQLGVRYAF